MEDQVHHLKDAAGWQRILADFGSFALQSNDLDEVLQKACELVADGLGERLTKIVELKEDGRLYLRAYVGFDPTEEQRWLEPGRGSSAGHALASGSPTLSNDAPNDGRFERAIVVSDKNVKSLVNVLIPDPYGLNGPWYGVLEVDSPRDRNFADAETEFLTLYANLIGAAVAASRGRAELARRLEDKDRLMAEFQHRVKNNLAVVGGFVRIQSREAGPGEARDHLDRITMRIETLRLLHERLYEHRTTERIAMRPYLMELIESLGAFHGSTARCIRLTSDIDAFETSADAAIPVGLLVNEFVSNSFKYAFGSADTTTEDGRIEIELGIENGTAHLQMSDNGVGMENGGVRGSGTGIKIMEGLAGQLDGALEWLSGPGTRASIRIPLD